MTKDTMTFQLWQSALTDAALQRGATAHGIEAHRRGKMLLWYNTGERYDEAGVTLTAFAKGFEHSRKADADRRVLRNARPTRSKGKSEDGWL